MNEIFYIDDREFEVIQALNLTSSKYLVIGGYAVQFYGHTSRQVNDLDIWINNTPENAQKVIEALKRLLSNGLDFSVEALINTKVKIDLRAGRYDVELFTTISGVSFEDAYSRRITATQNGDKIDMVSIQDLLTIKSHAVVESENRLHKELKDIGFLESIQRS